MRVTEKPTKYLYIVLSPNTNGNEFYLEDEESRNHATVFYRFPYQKALKSQISKYLGFIPGNFEWDNLMLEGDIHPKLRKTILSCKK